MPSTSPDISLIIPAYNERGRLTPHLRTVRDYMQAHYPSYELIVVDDGSQDGTAETLRQALAGEPRARVIAYQPNRGKGYAVRTGVLASRGQTVLFTDADLSTPMQEVPRALELLRQADMVIGSRDLPGAQIHQAQTWFRRFASEVFRWIRYALIGLQDIPDTQCGFKAYRGGVARQLYARSRIERFLFDIEILFLARKAGLRIAQLPVQWTDAPGSKVRFWQGVADMLRDLVRIRWMHRGKIVLSELDQPVKSTDETD